MATSPATMPEAAPSDVACPSRIRSVSSQPSIAAAVATVVIRNVVPAAPFDVVAEPALNPYHPNHRIPAPSITNGRLCGRIGVPGQPSRLPRMIASTRPATPALMCTAVPPAKSIALSCWQSSRPFSPVIPSNANTSAPPGNTRTSPTALRTPATRRT